MARVPSRQGSSLGCSGHRKCRRVLSLTAKLRHLPGGIQTAAVGTKSGSQFQSFFPDMGATPLQTAPSPVLPSTRVVHTTLNAWTHLGSHTLLFIAARDQLSIIRNYNQDLKECSGDD